MICTYVSISFRSDFNVGCKKSSSIDLLMLKKKLNKYYIIVFKICTYDSNSPFDALSKWHGPHYGNTGCGVFKWGVQNQKGFCLRINILKGNYWILRIGLVGASEVFKNQSFKSQLFSSSQKKKYLKLKSWLNLNAIINKIENIRQFSELFRWTIWQKLRVVLKLSQWSFFNTILYVELWLSKLLSQCWIKQLLMTTNTKEMGLCIFLRMRKLRQVFLFSLLYPDPRFDCQYFSVQICFCPSIHSGFFSWTLLFPL